jgi:D-alanyl-D-alanine carboxypeptidase/D-alanyl-D-alanine-endopeptidase (penicillin-binding protein 4)
VVALNDARSQLEQSGGSVSISVRSDAYGDVVNVQPDWPLLPASNQKLLIGIAVLEAIPGNDRLATTVIATGPNVDGVVYGDLVIVGGGDPDLARTIGQSPDSLDALASQVRGNLITRVEGRLIVDDTRYDGHRSAPGWPGDWPNYVGPLTAFAVDHNTGRKDAAYVNDPGLGNGELFRAALHAAGVEVAGGTQHGIAPPGDLVASVASMTMRELVTDMLTSSDNLTAELLVKELGYRRRGSGTTADGLAAAREILAGMCAGLPGNDVDGSGLSVEDRRTTATVRRLLDVARTRPWWTIFRDALPLAASSGTLRKRLTDPATAGNVRAKTGSTPSARALSGYLTTTGGSQVTFSIIVNGPDDATISAIDSFVTALAKLP